MVGFIDTDLYDFIEESNKIEGIMGVPKEGEFEAYKCFMAQGQMTMSALLELLGVIQPDAVLRDREGLNVRVGSYYPPEGSPAIANSLETILTSINKFRWEDVNRQAWFLHCEYESLHPFTDGNGRTGRALWAWMIRDMRIGFLHRFYYQTLQNTNRLQ